MKISKKPERLFNKSFISFYIINYPIPFNPNTSVDISSEGRSFCELIVNDIGGKKVSVIHIVNFNLETNALNGKEQMLTVT